MRERSLPYGAGVSILALLPVAIFAFAFFQPSLPPSLAETFLMLGDAARFLTFVGWAQWLLKPPPTGVVDPVTLWRAYTAILAGLVVLSVLMGGIGYLLSLRRTKTLALSVAPPGLQRDQTIEPEPPPMRGAAFWFRWLLSLQLAPCALAMLGAGTFRLPAGDSFNLLVAGLTALATGILCWVLGRDAMKGRPGYSFRGGDRRPEWRDDG